MPVNGLGHVLPCCWRPLPPTFSPSPLASVACQSWPRLMFDRTSIAAAAATVSARQVFLTLFFLDLQRTCWARIWSMALISKPFALMAAGIESLVAAFALHVTKKCAAISAQLWPCTHSFLKICWYASFWKYRKWVAGNNAHRGKRNSVVKPHYQAPHPMTIWNRSPMVWVG